MWSSRPVRFQGQAEQNQNEMKRGGYAQEQAGTAVDECERGRTVTLVTINPKFTINFAICTSRETRFNKGIATAEW